MRLRDEISADLAANHHNLKAQFILAFFRVAHRASSWRGFLWPAGRIIGVLYRILVEWVLGVEVPWKLQVGPGLRIYHGYGLVINDNAVLGRDVVLRHGVTVGHAFEGGGCPVIEDRVEFGANAIVIGDVRIGHDSRIGPGVVVRESVRPHSTVLAQPGNVRMRLGERSGADAVASEPSSEVR